MERAATYLAYAERWGWTPDQVDDLPVWLADRLLAAAVVYDEVQEDRRKAEQPG